MKISVQFLKRCVFAGLLFCGFFLLPTLNLHAQEGARIYHMTGRDFSLSLHGERKIYTAGAVSGNVINLEHSGVVHTGPGTFLEIQLIPSGTVVKLSENTSLIYNGVDETGKFEDLGLLYGRIRVVTGNGVSPAGINSVVVRGGRVSARIKQGDIGVDYLMEPGEPNSTPRPLFLVYAFRGSAEVFPFGSGENQAFFGNANVLTVEEGECLSLDVSSDQTFAEKKPLDRDIVAYWTTHNFSGSSPMQMPDTKIVMKEAPVEIREVEVIVGVPQPEPFKILGEQPPMPSNRGKNITLGIGLFLSAASAITQVVTHPQFGLIPEPNKEIARNVFNAAYVPLAMGAVATLWAIFYNPARQ